MRVLVAAVLSVVAALLPIEVAAGSPVGPGGGGFRGGIEDEVGGGSEGGTDGAGSSPDSPYDYIEYAPHCRTGLTLPEGDVGRGCADYVRCGPNNSGTVVSIVGVLPGGGRVNLGTGCTAGGTEVAPEAPAITPGMIVEAFERMPLPDSELELQPPGGETLVNFDTIFSTENATESTTLRLLGQSLEIEAEASSYEWHHGDGTTQTTDWEGQPFSEGIPMNRYISYRYQDAFETVEPSVDTTWSARYRLNGGPWQPVAGTVTIEGDPASLRVVEGQPNLVG